MDRYREPVSCGVIILYFVQSETSVCRQLCRRTGFETKTSQKTHWSQAMHESSLPGPFPPEKIWILGAGHFGFTAAQRLSRRYPNTDFMVVDLRADRLHAIHQALGGISCIAQDGISFLAQRQIPEDIWIVPAIPLHVAFQWLLAKIAAHASVQALPVPPEVDQQVPNPYRVAGGTVYTSFATFLCPDVCNEPEEICTYTKQPRPGNLFELLGGITVARLEVVVVRSWQLAPGVGGYTRPVLAKALSRITQQPGDYLVATSCRCHGVLDRLSWRH